VAEGKLIIPVFGHTGRWQFFLATIRIVIFWMFRSGHYFMPPIGQQATFDDENRPHESSRW
jgi:hypothetical protein